MAQAPSTSATKSLVAQAVAELHLGRLPEAEAALQEAMKKAPKDVEVVANSIVLGVISGKDVGELDEYVFISYEGFDLMIISFC